MKSKEFLYNILQEVCKGKYDAEDIETIYFFLVAAQTEKELVKLINSTQQNSEEEKCELISECVRMYPPKYIKKVQVISIGDKRFLLPKEDTIKFTQKHKEILHDLSNSSGLENPVYLSITETGILIVD